MLYFKCKRGKKERKGKKMRYDNRREYDFDMAVEAIEREAILKEIEETEMRAFLLDMKDRWTYEDYKTAREYEKKIETLKKQLH